MNNTESIKYLYPHEKTALFRALEADQSAHCLRNRAIFYLAEYCGMRASEVGLVGLSDINLPAKEIHVHRLKRVIATPCGSSTQMYLMPYESIIFRCCN